ncbi:hypothetical protein DYBT9275_04157 [Dyadobacter sp. CECT 9275]|uniref:non-specific protein-tyrosine kinase n=1 Tax=Dyadobacter helix TaxID=2822344 RepID=A0A916ND10_9BACT|nr:polysaccharide biosynthesis tyrosine autokinase [Dyadobacter sp. CECT 9275]CAG5007931.1 hypothetical protein DYBT9275_04157 [Dyadobacter sp. CECT 9275]
MANTSADNAFFERLLSNSESIDFKKLFKVFLSRWYWIIGSLGLFGVLCFLYLKFAVPQFVASVTVKYLEKQSELDEFSSSKPTYIFNSATTDYLTEKFNVRSQEVVENALYKLNNPFTFFRVKDFRKIDVYPSKPLDLEVISFDPDTYENGVFSITENLGLVYRLEEREVTLPLRLGAIVTVPGLSFKIKEISTAKGYEFDFVHNEIARQAENFIGRIGMEEVEEAMPVMNMSFRHHSAAFTKDFLEKLIEAYREFDLRQKQKSSDLTIKFINDQLGIYSDSLKVAARDLELFKKQNQVLDISSSANEITGKLRELEQEKQKLEIQRAYISILEKSLGTTFEPVNYLSVGLDAGSDGILISLLERFNELITKRKDLLLKYSPNAQAVKNIDEELNKFRTQILDNISLQKQKIGGMDKIMTSSISTFQKRFNQIPGLEKNYLYLQSNFEVNKNIYSLLLNKEIESSIVRAGMLPSFVVITRPDIDKVSPKSIQIIILAIFFGLSFGIGSILLARFTNGKFTEIGNVEAHPKVTLLGVVQHFPEKVTNTSKDLNLLLSDRSIFTESLSSIRTKLSFAGSNLEKREGKSGKQLLITSEKSGEGKSFVTINLALSLTKTGKKVIVIGADLRKSKLHHYFDDRNKNGLSEYLQEKEKDINVTIRHSSVPNLDYIVSGIPPFNPGELLQTPLFEELLKYCRQNYDYVLLDTAPAGLVADNIPLLTTSDHVLFIIRWLYSEKDSYRLAGQLADDYNVKDVKIIINDFYADALHTSITSGSGYSSGYNQYRYDYSYRDNGYYTEKPRNLIKRIFNLR